MRKRDNKSPREQKYIQSRSQASAHYKWDSIGLGPHQAYCSKCKRIVQWEPLGEYK